MWALPAAWLPTITYVWYFTIKLSATDRGPPPQTQTPPPPNASNRRWGTGTRSWDWRGIRPSWLPASSVYSRLTLYLKVIIYCFFSSSFEFILIFYLSFCISQIFSSVDNAIAVTVVVSEQDTLILPVSLSTSQQWFAVRKTIPTLISPSLFTPLLECLKMSYPIWHRVI
jgi:hypothetical protein